MKDMNPKPDKEKTKSSNLLHNNKFLFAISILISLCVWVYISATQNDGITTRTITGVPINIELSNATIEKGLSVFPVSDYNGSVEVSGNSMELSRLDFSNIQLVSQEAQDITSVGTYELALMAKIDSSFNSVSADQNTVTPAKTTVMVDHFKQSEFNIESDINYKTSLNYFASSVSLTPSSVTISGPETIASKVKRVVAKYNIVDELTTSVKFDAPLIFYDEDNNVISDSDLSLLTISKKTVSGEIVVMKKTVYNLQVTTSNMPSGFDTNRISLSPSQIDVAVSTSTETQETSLTVGTIDFSKFEIGGNTFKFPISLPRSCKNLSNTNVATATIDTTDLISKSLDVDTSKVEFVNLPEGKKATALNNTFKITVNGPTNEVNSISPDNITIVLDLSGKEGFSGHTEIPVTFKIDGYTGSWVSGSYKANVAIE